MELRWGKYAARVVIKWIAIFIWSILFLWLMFSNLSEANAINATTDQDHLQSEIPHCSFQVRLSEIELRGFR